MIVNGKEGRRAEQATGAVGPRSPALTPAAPVILTQRFQSEVLCSTFPISQGRLLGYPALVDEYNGRHRGVDVERLNR